MKRNGLYVLVLLLLFARDALAGAEFGNKAAFNSYLGETVIINRESEKNLASVIEQFNKRGGTIILDTSVKTGPMPVRPNHKTRIVDLRYQGGINMVRGNHPRLEGIWPQYSHLNTGLGRNFVLTDVLPYDAQVESWKGELKPPNPVNTKRALDSNEYSNSHNHYQNMLSEVWSFSPTVNAVALWGDSGSFYPGSKSWGGFLSARSWPVHWQEYVPVGTPGFEDKDFDAQLVGLEVDVLNGGLPHGRTSKLVGHSLDKTGIQIVGFGNRNSAAIELRSEDSDDAGKKPDERRGTWQYGIIAYNALHSDSTLIATLTPVGKTGVDFSRTRYADSALKIKSEGSHTGISFNNYAGGEIYSEGNRLVARIGEAGFSVLSPSGHEIIRIDKFGEIRWNGINIAYIPVYMIPVFMLMVLLAMAVIAYRFARQIRVAQLQLDQLRGLTSGAGVQP